LATAHFELNHWQAIPLTQHWENEFSTVALTQFRQVSRLGKVPLLKG
jgi:hypothetical protein